jgi:peptidoglycan/LPS O-acetylase OafA/YrhL
MGARSSGGESSCGKDGNVKTGAAGERFHRPELDGLRFLAFFAVFLAHVFHAVGGVPLAPTKPLAILDVEWWLRGAAYGGVFGVDLFFALSGYLITTLLLREESLRGRIDVRAFWMRRILRIWPAYYLLVVVAIALNKMSGGAVIGYLTFTANLPFFAVSVFSDPIRVNVLWSVQIEEQFYLVWPLLLVLAPRRFRLVMAIGAVAVSVAGRAWWMLFTEGTLFAWGFRVDALGVGAMLAMLPLGAAPRLVKWLGSLLPLAAVAGAGFALQALHVGDPGLRVRAEWIPVVVLVPTAVALCCGAALWAAQSSHWLCWRPLTHLGRISYGLYLVHYTVISGWAFLWWPWCGVVSFVVSVLLAEVSYRVVERPFLKLKDRFAYIASGSDTPGFAGAGVGVTDWYIGWYKARRIRPSDAKETM